MKNENTEQQIDPDLLRTRKLSGTWRWLLVVATAATVFLCINQQFVLRFFVGFTPLNTEYYYALITVMLPFIFIVFPAHAKAPKDRVPWYDALLFVLTGGVGFLLMIHVREAAELGWEFTGAPEPIVITGYLMWGLLLECLRRTGGLGLVLSIAPFTFYPIFADSSWLGPLKGSESTAAQASAYHMLSSESLLGIPLRAFAETVIGFLMFGIALMATGAGKFFLNLAFVLCGKYRGGAAKVSIFASGLLGSMSGSIISNVLTSGTLTIPAMKRTGFHPTYAGAVEACASTGAVIAPPVMGATAFVMAQFLNISYAEVALAAVIPASLYYLGLFLQVDAYAARHGLKGLEDKDIPSLKQTLREGWYYLFAIILLIFMLLVMKRESHAPFYATALLIALNQILNPKERWGWKELAQFLESNGRTFAELIGILAGCGLLIGAFSLTGVISSLANDLLSIAGSNVFLLLAMTALTSLFLGMGLTTTACYIFLAILVGPALEKAGLNSLAVHMFVFYWGMLSSITPPVAIASFAAAGLAGSTPIQTGLVSMKMGSIIYFLPFFFVLNPAFVLQGPWMDSLILVSTAIVGIVLICGGLQGYLMGFGDLRLAGKFEWLLRIALCCGGFVLAAPGGGIMPLGHLQMLGLAASILLPSLAFLFIVRQRQA